MIRELLNALVTEYDRINGTGTLLVLFVVAVLLVVLLPLKERPALFEKGTGIIASILSMWGMAAYALTELIKRVFSALFATGKSHRFMSAILAAMTAALCIFGLMLSGNLPKSAGTVSLTENPYHIDGNLAKALDYMLSEVETETSVTVLARPGLGNIMKAYSSRFVTLYDEPSRDEDILYYDEDIRNLYAELSDGHPNMFKVSKIARAHGCRFFIAQKGDYWPEFPITFYNSELVNEFGNWELYRFIYEEGDR